MKFKGRTARKTRKEALRFKGLWLDPMIEPDFDAEEDAPLAYPVSMDGEENLHPYVD